MVGRRWAERPHISESVKIDNLQRRGLGESTRKGVLNLAVLVSFLLAQAFPSIRAAEATRFDGNYFSGSGDKEYLELLDTARRMFAPDPEFQNVAMLYMPSWNGLVEGPTWDAWWIQNSYGTTYGALPFLEEPFVTFIENSHELWFSQMGDGKRTGAAPPFNWVAPDGCLCDAARPGWIVYKQGDGRTAIHDWGMEFTAAGLLLQAEFLLIQRDTRSLQKNLPRLERCAAFIETRRNPTNQLFLAGPAGNLLAPSYSGWKRPDGSYDRAYLTGLSVTYIAALDRLIELEKLAGRTERATTYAQQQASAKSGLSLLTTEDGYLIRSLDPDGTRHGVFEAPRHGYFEASPNHDAVCFRVVNDAQAEKILRKMTAIPGLRPHQFILPNYPSYDDLYEKPEGLWEYGTWVNGGHWSTCEARMILAYYRFGYFEDVRRSMKHLLEFARRFRMDNPLVKCGAEVYQPREPINLTYDAFGPPAALVRGLFEYLYSADTLTIVPHVPPGMTELEQHFPIRFGTKRIYIATRGQGGVKSVFINGKAWKQHDQASVALPYDSLPERAELVIALSNSPVLSQDDLERMLSPRVQSAAKDEEFSRTPSQTDSDLALLVVRYDRMEKFLKRLEQANLGDGYPAAHVRLARAAIRVTLERHSRGQSASVTVLSEPARVAANRLYVQTATRLADGLDAVLHAYEKSSDPRELRIFDLFRN